MSGAPAADVAHIASELRPLARPVAELREDPKNARRHDEANLAAIKGSLSRHGQRKPIVVKDGVVIAGNGTLKAAKALGWQKLACVEYDGPEAFARAFALEDNRTAELAAWDEDELASSLKALADEGIPTGELGWDEKDLAKILAPDKSGAQDPGPGDPPANPVSKPGQLYELGPHRLPCGDATDGNVVARLFTAKKASLVWTDPPYGVGYEGGPLGDRKAISNDGDEEVAEETARDALRLAYLHAAQGASVYQAAPSRLLPSALRALAGSGFTFKHEVVWVKDSLVMGRADYHYRHEPILYGWKEDGAHYFVDDRTQDSVFEVPRPKRSEDHPTMKPVELVERMVRNSSRVGEVVYDPFAGSGTTLIACARINRRFVGCELDPGYVDVIRRRWTAWAKLAGEAPGSGALESA